MNIAYEINILNQSQIVRDLERLKELLRINLSINFNLNEEDIKSEVASSVERLMKHINDDNTYVIGVHSDDYLIGFLWCYGIKRITRNVIHISHIIIDEPFRSLGIGKLLLKQVEIIAKKCNVTSIDLFTSISNANAIGFYEKNNYEISRVLMSKEMDAIEDKKNPKK